MRFKILLNFKLILILLYGFNLPNCTRADIDAIVIDYLRNNNINSLIYVTCIEKETDFEIFERVEKFTNNDISIGVFKKSNGQEFNIPEHSHNLGILLQLECPQSNIILRRSEQNNYFSISNFWILLGSSLNFTMECVKDIFMPPCSQVVAVHSKSDQSKDFEITSIYKAAPHMPLRIDTSSSSSMLSVTKSNRNNLEGIYLKSGIVIVFPDIFTTVYDLRMRHIDTMARVNYPISMNLGEDLNFQFDMIQVDNFGWRRDNGTFDGFVGHFQRNEVDFGNIAIFMRLDRIPVIDFAAETVRFRACIMFRQPPLSAVTNIFAMPFSGHVWLAILIFLIITMIAMGVVVIYSAMPVDMNWMDCVNFVLGAICQQGFYVNIVARSGRILIFSTFVTSVFLFTSFSANIVALLQSPSETITTLRDLTMSPLELGAQDTIYNKVYFKETTDPVTKLLYEKKISPKGESVFMRPAIGIKRMRKELFAYQVESQAAYKIISDTFNEPEKCGLQELEPFQLPPMSIPMRKKFPYRELFRQRLRWQREVGLIKREAIRWIPQKPQCESKLAGFISVGLTECRYTLHMLAVGMLLALVIFLGETIYHKLQICYQLKR